MTEPARRQPALAAIHDVMPSTLEAVAEVLGFLEQRGVHPVTLLVVPGAEWSPAGLDRLRRWQARGHELAGHGWHHRVQRYGSLYHRLHAALVSRDVAEHLALDADGIADLLTRNHAWFADQNLPAPSLYVPPAWAMGPIPRKRLRQLPFARYESTAGVYDAPTDRFHPLPLVGYEADTPMRVPPLSAWNALNLRLALPSRPLRLSIHPHDLRYPMAGALARLLEGDWRWLRYRDLARDPM